MKDFKLMVLVVAAAGVLQACNDSDARYTDLNTGRSLELEKDAKSGLMVNKENGEPVEIYVDSESGDTILGRTGKVINGYVVKSNDGKYVYRINSEDNSSVNSTGTVEGEYKIKIGDDYKKKVEKDGDIKIKDGDKKIKIDGETGERKVKTDN